MTAVLDGWARLVTGRRSAWAVIAGWLLLLVVAAPLAAGLGETQSTDPVNYLPAGAQSTALQHELAEVPGGNVSPAVVIYARPTTPWPPPTATYAARPSAEPAVTRPDPPGARHPRTRAEVRPPGGVSWWQRS